MGSCISTKGRRTSSKYIRTQKIKNGWNALADKCVPNKTKTTKIKSAPTFIHIPAEQITDIADFTTDLIIKQTSTKAHNADFCNIYRNSDIVDKKLFLNSGFLVFEESSSFADTASGMVSPIECKQHRKVVEGTFLLSPDIMTSIFLLTSSALPTTPVLVDSEMTNWGLISPIECEQYRKIVEGTFLLSPDIMTSPDLLTSTAVPTTPALVDSERTAWEKNIARNNTATQYSQRKTFMSEDITSKRNIFSFEDDAIESLQNVFTSSFKQDSSEMF